MTWLPKISEEAKNRPVGVSADLDLESGRPGGARQREGVLRLLREEVDHGLVADGVLGVVGGCSVVTVYVTSR